MRVRSPPVTSPVETNNPATPSRRRPELVDLQRTLYASRNPTRRWLHTSRRDLVAAELRRIAALEGFERAAEIGPGAGPYVALLCERFAEVTVTDIEEEYLESVRVEHGRRENLRLLFDDVVASRLRPASLDLVLCSEVIEHAPAPAQVVAGLRRVLRPGGTLVLTTPQARSTLELASKIAFLPGIIDVVRRVYREPILPTGHISLLTVRQVRELLTANGFRVLEHDTWGLYLPLVSELGGQAGLSLERRLEGRISRGRLDGLLWTQSWIAERAR